MRVGEGPFFLARERAGQHEDLGLDVLRPQFAALDLGRAVPVGGGLALEDLAHHHPFEVRQRPADESGVVAADGGVLAHEQEPSDEAVLYGEHHRLLRVVAHHLRQPGVAPAVRLRCGVAVPGSEQADHVFRKVVPPARWAGLRGQETIERGVLLVRDGLRQIAGQQVVERRDVGAALDARMAAQGQDPATRTPDVAEQRLQDRAGANHLNPGCVMRPSDRVAPRRRALPAGVLRDGLSHLQEHVTGAPGHALDHLRRVASVVAAHDLVHAPRMLQRAVGGWWAFLEPIALGRVRLGQRHEVLGQARGHRFPIVLPAVVVIALGFGIEA